VTSSRHHNIYIDGAVCFWTSSIIDHLPVFRSPTAVREVLAVLDQCRARYGVKLVGYVLMPEHIHLAVWAERAETVQLFLRQFLRMACARSSTTFTPTPCGAAWYRWRRTMSSLAPDGTRVVARSLP